MDQLLLPNLLEQMDNSQMLLTPADSFVRSSSLESVSAVTTTTAISPENILAVSSVESDQDSTFEIVSEKAAAAPAAIPK